MNSPTRRIFYSYDCIFFYLRGVISLHKGCIWETGLALRIFPFDIPTIHYLFVYEECFLLPREETVCF